MTDHGGLRERLIEVAWAERRIAESIVDRILRILGEPTQREEWTALCADGEQRHLGQWAYFDATFPGCGPHRPARRIRTEHATPWEPTEGDTA